VSRITRGANLPTWRSVLAVVAHPDDESCGLGAVIDAFAVTGARVSVLCFTHGEASTLHGVGGNLREIRQLELQEAAKALGVCDVKLAPYPDGGLGNVGFEELVAVARDAAALFRAEGLLAFDSSGVTGHPDHIRATEVAIKVGESERLGVLGWTLPAAVANVLQDECGASFIGHVESEMDVELVVSRIRQRAAIACHPSQAVPGSVLWRRLELLGDVEHLRWLCEPA
jgi:LmbE family N-acetylglucosaminyl deacetylase